MVEYLPLNTGRSWKWQFSLPRMMLRSTGLRKSTARYDEALPMCSRWTLSSVGLRSTSIATAPAPCVGSPELPRAYSAMSALTTIAQRSSPQREVAQRVLQRVDAAQAGVLDLGYLAMARQRRTAARLEAFVEHAFDDDGAGGVVGARLGAEPQEANAVRVDVVVVDEPHDGRGGHRIDALRGPAHPKAVADDGAGLVPDVVRPATPRLEVYAVRRHVDGKAADTHFVGHRTPSSACAGRRCVGATVSAPRAII